MVFGQVDRCSLVEPKMARPIRPFPSRPYRARPKSSPRNGAAAGVPDELAKLDEDEWKWVGGAFLGLVIIGSLYGIISANRKRR